MQNGRGNGDELHVVVYDYTGDISGFDVDSDGNRTNAVLETYSNYLKIQMQKLLKVVQIIIQM